MIRLFIFGVIAVFGIVASVLSLFLVFAVIRWMKQLFFGSHDFVNKQYGDWKAKKKTEQVEKSVPDFLRQGSLRLKHIDQYVNQLPEKWKLLLNPVIGDAHAMLAMGMSKPDQAQSARSFYTVTLKALEGFAETLVDMKMGMQEEEEEKARQSIEVFMNDIYKYRAKFESKKRFDFHVMMEVIKQRIGK
ncbi:MAG: hypothetical protein V3U78_05260 [Thiotrichaceae bacterium]